MSFRIGRSRAQHTYPDTPRGASGAYARNSAFGPLNGTQAIPASGGTKVRWAAMEVGATGGTTVPITPQVTGIVRAIVNVVAVNPTDAADDIAVQFVVDGVPVSGGATVSTLPAALESQSGAITIPLVLDFAGSQKLSVGVAHTIEVLVTSVLGVSGKSVTGLSTVDLQELPAATG
jgi:hypothetical protein